jgi:hypothetical protein
MNPRTRTWSRRLFRAGAFWLIVPWTLSGCDIPDNVRAELAWQHNQIKTFRGWTDFMGRRMGQIEDYLTYCPDEVQRLVGRVEKECETQEYCSLSEADIRLEVRNVAPWAGGRFLSLMQDRKHIALYPGADGRLSDAEKKQLRDLVLPAWLDDGARRTRFLVVSHAADNQPDSLLQASSRGKRVIREITSLAEKMNKEQMVAAVGQPAAEPLHSAFPVSATTAESTADAPGPTVGTAAAPPTAAAAPPPARRALPRYLLHWAVPFPRGGEPLRGEDQPRQRGDKPNSSVFVYRVDC